MKKYNFITKQFLQKEYIQKRKSIDKIAKEIGCVVMTVWRNLKKYNIKTRTLSEAHADFSGENNPSFKGGVCSKKKYYCIDCGKEISKSSGLYGQGRCQSCSAKGKRHWNWQGGKTSLYFLIRNLPEYREWRQTVFERDWFTCTDCGEYASAHLNTHHKKPFAELLSEFLKEYDQFSPIEDKETLIRLAIKWKLFWDVDNGQTLCEDCHKQIRKIK